MSEAFHAPEGATPIQDISDLKPKTIVSRRQLDAAEAANNAKAIKRFLPASSSARVVWKEPKTLKQLHYEMFCDVWKWAGHYRTTVTNIGVKPYLIAQELVKLCGDIAGWELPVLEQAVRIHHRLVYIHPFENGNGRHARFVSDLFLTYHDQPVPQWPTDFDSSGSSRRDYIDTLRSADKGDLEPLMNYVVELL